MNTASLFLTSILLSSLTSYDNSNTKNLEIADLYYERVFSVADITKVNLYHKSSRNTFVFAYHQPRLIIKAADPLLDYETSNNRHNSKESGIKNKYATLPDTPAKRKKRKRNSGLKIPNGTDIKNQYHDFLSHDFNKIKRKVIV